VEDQIPLESVDRFRLPICEHVRTFKGPRDPLGPEQFSKCGTHRVRPVDPDRENERSTVFAPELKRLARETTTSCKALRSCWRCYTDYCLIIEWGKDGHHSLELSTYHGLGRCRTVHERVWQSLGWRKHFDASPDRREDHEEFGLGAIHARWHRSRRESNKEMEGVIPAWVVGIESRWAEFLNQSKNVTPANYDDLMRDLGDLNSWYIQRSQERAIFLDEENEDKFGQPFMS
jgi:hypothetical protein